VDGVAALAQVTWKQEDSRTLVQHYEFLGGSWHHPSRGHHGSVELSSKIRQKLPARCPTHLSLLQAEQLVGRLISAAGLLCLPLANYYFAFKWFRRLQNDYHRGLVALDLNVQVYESARQCMDQWLRDALATRYFPQHEATLNWTLFTDASLSGYGAILAAPWSELFIYGESWFRSFEASDINFLEALAVLNALRCFEWILSEEGATHVRVIVDNTSVKFSLSKGHSKSEKISSVIQRILRIGTKLECSFSFAYIRTDLNPADPISRGRALDLQLASGALDWRRGVVEAEVNSRVLPQ
jgi:hypothetical protein